MQSHQTNKSIFHRTRTKDLKICIETQNSLNSQSNLKKNGASGIRLVDFRRQYKAKTVSTTSKQYQFSSVAYHVQLFVTPWTAACQASLSINNSWSLFRLMSFELVMPSNHLILCLFPYPPAFNLSQHQGLFQGVSSLHQVAKVLEF